MAEDRDKGRRGLLWIVGGVILVWGIAAIAWFALQHSGDRSSATESRSHNVATNGTAGGSTSSTRSAAGAQSRPAKRNGDGGRTFYSQPESYDLAKINADAGYYGRVDPSRTWQKAPLPEGKRWHEQLIITGRPIWEVIENAKLPEPLSVRGKPGRPVTFTALDGGRFANGANSTTIKSDANGVARIDFWVGGSGGYRVHAGSPENAGPAVFQIQAMTARELADVRSGKYARDYLAAQAAAKRQRAERARALEARIAAKRAATRRAAGS